MKTTTTAKLVLMATLSISLTGVQFAASLPSSPARQQSAPDNTRMNKGDAQSDSITADQQKMNPTDRTTTQKIRSEIMKDKSLSTYAHNIKIVTREGKVTLKGPVRSDEEKSSVEAKARSIAGNENVTSQIEVAPPKS
jgi:osmotically-inducible protein OsmY